MFLNQDNMELNLFDLEELSKPENRVKMCYAFMRSNNLFHQELAIFNPNPTQFLPNHVFPADLYIFSYHNESGDTLLPLEKLQKIAADAATPVNCIGSHIEGKDRTLQLIALPQSMATAKLKPKDLIFVRFLTQVSELEKEAIMEDLEKEYLSM